jgi:signal transduction histidine kinase
VEKLSFALVLLFTRYLLIPAADAQIQGEIVLADSQSQYPVGLYMEILEDKDKEWTIEDVTSPDIAAQFVPSSEEVPGFGFTDSAYWVRFEARNEADSDIDWLLLYDSDSFYIDYYLPAANGGGYDVIHTGSALPFDTRDVPVAEFVFQLPIEAQDSETVHMRFASGGTLILPLTILSDSTYAQQTLTQQVFNGILYGVLFILALYNLVLFFNLRDRTYLYYVLFFSTMLLGIMALDGFAAQYLWPNQGTFAAMATRLFFIMSFTFGLMFTNSFLRTSENAPRLHKIMAALAILIFVFLGLQLIWFRVTAVVHVFLMIASGISMLLAGVVVWREGYRPASYFLVGWSVVLIGFIIFLLTLIDVIPVSTLGDTIIRIGLIVLGLVLSTGLAERINAYRQELKEEVASKTKKLEKEIIEHEEAELKLRKARDEMAALLEVSQDVAATLDPDSLLKLIIEQLEQVVEYDEASIHLLVNGVLKQQAYHHNEQIGIRPPGQLQYSEVPMFREMIDREAGFVIPDLQQAPELMTAILTYSEPDFLNIPSSVHSFMAAPMIVRKKGIGMLAVSSVRIDIYDQASLNLLQIFANQAAIAIENAQLYEQAKNAAAAEERSRLARDLHDSVTQSIYSATLLAEVLPEIEQRDPNQARQGLEELRQLTRGALAEMRTMLLELRPETVVKTPLDDLLEQLVGALTARMEVEAQTDIRPVPILSPETHINMYRVAQEALNNVVKHSEASQLVVTLLSTPPPNEPDSNGWRGQIKLLIADNGKGFDDMAIPADSLGLGIMRERSAEIEADFTIDSQPGQGTTVTMIWRSNDSQAVKRSRP